jgi:hypothetical protein
MVGMRDEYLADFHIVLIIHKCIEVFKEKLVWLRIVPWFYHEARLSPTHNKAIGSTQSKLTWIVTWNVVDEVL